MGDWQMECTNPECGKVVTIDEITKGCPKCGGSAFKVVKMPDGSEFGKEEPPSNK